MDSTRYMEAAREANEGDHMPRRISMGNLLICGLSAAALGACDPRVYKYETVAFTSATKAAFEAFQAAQKAEIEAATRTSAANVLAQRGSFSAADACAALTDAGTAFIAGTAGGRPLDVAARRRVSEQFETLKACSVRAELPGSFVQLPSPIESARVSKLLSYIAEYGGLLVELAGAEDVAAVDAQGTQLRGALKGLAGALSEGGLIDIGDVSAQVDPLIGALQWLGLKYLEHKRYVALRSAADAAHPLMIRAEPILTTAFVGLVLSRLTDVDRSMQTALAMPRTVPQVQDGVALANQVSMIGRADPTKTFELMVASHAAFHEELRNPSSQRERLFTELKAFKAHVDDLREAFEKR